MDPAPIDADLTAMADSDELTALGERAPATILMSVERYAGSLAMVAVSTLVGLWIAPRWGTAPVDMIYLPAVLAAAALWGLGPALLAGIGAALAYNYFFTSPIHTFRMDRLTDVVTVIVLLIVALVTSQLASRIRAQARLAAAHSARNATIAGFAGRLLSCRTEKGVAEAACEELHRLFECNTMLVTGLPEPAIVAALPEGNRLTPTDVAAAALTIESGEAAGRATARMQPAEWVFYPVRSSADAIAAAGLARDDGAPPVHEEQVALLTNLLDQVSLALERTRADADSGEVMSLRERDRLRSALLSSVGHDLRSPLTGIIGAAAELRCADKLDPALVRTISSEAGKLERYISNLLDMARIESGAVKLRTEPVDLVDAVSAALKDLRGEFGGEEPGVDLPDDLPLVIADAQLLHHCLINLIDNALRYSVGGGPIRVFANTDRGEVFICVEDEGPGLPQDRERALDTFMRMEGSDRSGGAGLGLAIVKAFAEAMGTKVTATNRADRRGAVFAMRFPKTLVIHPAEAADAG
jgi:two-component system sensor histidine kinase KdpD